MPQTLRIATFNAENLFNRAKVFNLDWDKAHGILTAAADLQRELDRATLDKGKIGALLKKVKGYAKINEVRGKWRSAKSGKEFQGWVELTREKVTDKAQRNTARVIKMLNADIICLVEVEDRLVLDRFDNGLLKPIDAAYSYNILIDGNDDRGIDVAVMSRYPFGAIRTHIFDKANGQPIFSRDCLEVEILLPGGRSCWMLANHFKSQAHNPSNDPNGSGKRTIQARRVAEILQGHDLVNNLVVVAGDLNDVAESPALQPLTSNPNLFGVTQQLPAADRWTYYYKGRGQQLDHLFVSRPLRTGIKGVHIERQGMFKIDKYTGGAIKPLPTIKSDRDSASDHGAIVSEFLV